MSDSRSSVEIRESLSPLKQAFLALEEAEQRIRRLEQKVPEPIAIMTWDRMPVAPASRSWAGGLLAPAARPRMCCARRSQARLGLSMQRETCRNWLSGRHCLNASTFSIRVILG